jgi:hypothetical protein
VISPFVSVPVGSWLALIGGVLALGVLALGWLDLGWLAMGLLGLQPNAGEQLVHAGPIDR